VAAGRAAAGLPFLFVPITLASYTGIPAEKSNDASGLINFMRNIGSSVGTSMVTTMLARRAQLHQSVLSYHTTNYDTVFQNQVAAATQQLIHAGTSAADARIQAYGMIYQSMQAQAQTCYSIPTGARNGRRTHVPARLHRSEERSRAGGEAAVG
jgi:DHA2 family multidrug resistance protein